VSACGIPPCRNLDGAPGAVGSLKA
jgi:hypothetical protein